MKAGLKFTSKKVLKLAIILLGASLSVNVILSVGKMSLMVMVFTLLICFGGFKKAGLAPMLHGFTISALVVVVALGVECCMGLV